MKIKGIRDNKAWHLVNNFVLFVKSGKENMRYGVKVIFFEKQKGNRCKLQ